MSKVKLSLYTKLIWACVMIKDLLKGKKLTKIEKKSIYRQANNFEKYAWKHRNKYE